jgi:hypothetical protein
VKRLGAKLLTGVDVVVGGQDSKVGIGAVATEMPRPRVQAPAFSAIPSAVVTACPCPLALCLSLLHHFTLDISIMAGFQRLIISLLVILTFTFVFFAQSSEAVKGPKITHKVHTLTF